MTGATIPDDVRVWIEEKLDSVSVVSWDRFTVGRDSHNEGEVVVDVYGWIEREEDDYKDFLHVTLWSSNRSFSFTTSSDRYSERIYRELVGEETEEHNECRRVEHTFDVEHAIELTTNSKLDVYADGGRTQNAESDRPEAPQ